MEGLLPLGSHKVMGSFAGYSVSVSTFEIVPLFFNGFFFWCLDSMDCFFGLFSHAWGPRTVRLAHTVQLFLCVKTSCMSFFCRGLVYSFGHQKTFFLWPTRSCFVFPMPEEDLWCLKKTRDAWRSLTNLSTLQDIVLDVDTKLSCASDTNLAVTYTLRLTD